MFSRTLSGMARLSAVRSPATRPMPALHRRVRAARGRASAGQHDAAGIDAGEPEQRAADLLLAGAAQAHEADHLAGAQGQRRPARRRRSAAPRSSAPRPWPLVGARTNTCSGGRPTIIVTSSSGVVAADRACARPAGRRAARPPRRRPRTPRPGGARRRSCRRRAPRRPRSTANSRVTSSAGRLAVGSSSTRISRLDGQRPGDGDQRLLGPGQAADAGVGSMAPPTAASARARARSACRQSISPKRRGKPWPIAMFSATVIHSIRPRS